MKRCFMALTVAVSMVIWLTPFTPQAASPTAANTKTTSSTQAIQPQRGGIIKMLMKNRTNSFGYPPRVVGSTDTGLHWVEPGNPRDLAAMVAHLAKRLPGESALGRQASSLYQEAFSGEVIAEQMQAALASAQALRSR